ncbi:hypothetical protein [Amycolatopsis sp. 195334CR]|uniref:hypothetical protein n=1 Tax=Amycolatopsis sp. 195334CR TaxID=2814588 RepID=UPI001A8E2BCE|nr:hypothetical protein [Amycolatopsis sp. 195334CR]MBN6039654.1 hypothetical protein [Amycolatopsis sp. 195334CR]
MSDGLRLGAGVRLVPGGAVDHVSSAAAAYREASVAETEDWSGSGGADYRSSAAQLADGIEAAAQASTAASGGASAAAAIPQVVRVAVEYGGRIAEKMGVLLSSAANLLKLVHGAVAALDVLDEALSSLEGPRV